MYHIPEEKFRLLIWLPASERFDQWINFPYYLNEILEFAPHCRISTRTNFSTLTNPFRKTNMGQKTISYIDLSLYL